MTDQRSLLVAIDGGATKTLLRITQPDGTLLSEAQSGPSNIATDVEQAARSIRKAFDSALNAADLGDAQQRGAIRWIAVAGIAGTESSGRSERLRELCDFFSIFSVYSDAYTSCVGAHGGKNGAIVAIGTGSVGYAIAGDRICRVGGWGFPQSDEGGGARIGLRALQHMLCTMDGRCTETALSECIRRNIEKQSANPLTYGIGASATQFASLTPLVVRSAKNGCRTAQDILAEAAGDIANIARTLLREKDFSNLDMTLLGSLAPILEPWLPEDIKERVTPPQGSALDGAMCLASNIFSLK
ncbi:BadF/BadG/BcrA/BcrD ATPase family protein [Acetobacter sp.]|uniref:BadF/BadG/BcrA/BcrD ATPase family protein n=1 Tax=Acetobacter sp. TaxID=440 RepID=UPI0039ECE268